MDQAPAFVEALVRIEKAAQDRLQERDRYWEAVLEYQRAIVRPLTNCHLETCSSCGYLVHDKYLVLCDCDQSGVCISCARTQVEKWSWQGREVRCRICGYSSLYYRHLPSRPN